MDRAEAEGVRRGEEEFTFSPIGWLSSLIFTLRSSPPKDLGIFARPRPLLRFGAT